MVGYELLAETQRDLTPEQAAQRLRIALDADAGAEPEAAGSPDDAAEAPDDATIAYDGAMGRDGAGPAR